jgi:uncharacterized protein (DUF2336 family)
MEVVSWPESRIPVFERDLAADLLLTLLRTMSVEVRRRCAERLAHLCDAPKPLLRYLVQDEITVASPLIENGVGFDDSDLIAAVRGGVSAHWQLLARRRGLSQAVTDALVQVGDVPTIEAVLQNRFAQISSTGVGICVTRSRKAPQLATLLVQRPELRPAEGLALFWWAAFAERVQILRRFAVDRAVLIAEFRELFGLATQPELLDAETRQALQAIERHQRNRAAAARSEFGSIERAIAAAEDGADARLLNEIGYMGGVKPATTAQIFADPGGEAIAVFAKSVGLKRPHLLVLWAALQRPPGDPERTDNPLGRMLYVFDTLATAKAQTVLRYWNWTNSAPVLEEADAADDRGEGRRRPPPLFTTQA